MSDWRQRVDRREGDMAHGITFVMLERQGPTTRGEVTVGQQKIHLDGTCSLTLALNQTKYGDELIAQMYSEGEPRILERRSARWQRVQIYLGPADLGTAAVLERLAQVIRKRANAIS